MEKQIRTINKNIAYIRYDNLWRSEFHIKIFANYRVQYTIFHQSKIKAEYTYKKIERITSNFEHSNSEEFVSKVFLDTKSSKMEGLYFI